MRPHQPDLRNAILAAIVDSSDDAIISKDLKGMITTWNNGAERVFGYTSEEAIGKSIMMLLPQGREHEEVEILAKIHKGIRLDHFDTLRKTKSGKIINISLTVSPIYFEDKIIGASKIARDITAQKETETLIVEHSEHLEIINNISREIVYELNVEKVVAKVTEATTKICKAACGIFLYDLEADHGKSHMLFESGGTSTKRTGIAFNEVLLKNIFHEKGTIRTKDIEKLEPAETDFILKLFEESHCDITSCMAIPIISKTGLITGGLFFGHSGIEVFKKDHEKLIESIASQTAIALENARLYEEIKSLNSRKDEFIGFASHELKTPLTTIKGFVQMGIQDPEQIVEFLPKINKQIDRLSSIIEDLLDITRIDSGKLDLTLSPISLSSLIKNCLESIIPIAKSHRIKNFTVDEEINLNIDAHKMEQVLINILTNSIKYSPPDTEISIKAKCINDNIQISITDQGRGISNDQIHKIYTLFYRIQESSTPVKGLGIGLYLSQQIILAHHGKIWVDSEIGKGSTFFIEFPIDAT
ncbi:MAG: ATP-binding protein [Ferruginibacter sp.]